MRYIVFHIFSLLCFSGGKKGKLSMIQTAKKRNYLVPEKLNSGTVFEGNHLGKTYLGSDLTTRVSSNRKVLSCWTSALLWISQLCCSFSQITTLSKPKQTRVNESIHTSSKYFFSFSLSLHFSTASSSKQYAVYFGFPPPPFFSNFFVPCWKNVCRLRNRLSQISL